MTRAYSKPLIVSEIGQQAYCRTLERIPLQERGKYDERWVQMLVHESPAVLPIDQIEPAFVGARPICVELAVHSGFADNLLVTPSGGIVLVETKLWRNPEARREAIAQILDYAKDLSRWSYAEHEEAVSKARKEPRSRLFDLARSLDEEPADEAAFVDAVARNLRLGRFLCLIVGDGIQESLEELVDFVQRYVAWHFTLALVELSLWRVPDAARILVQPRVIARTVQIERAVVRSTNGLLIEPAPPPAVATRAKATTITEEEFFEHLAETDSALPARLKSFLGSLENFGVFIDLKKTMNLKLRDESGSTFALGMLESKGQFWPFGDAKKIGREDLDRDYQTRILEIAPAAEKVSPKSIRLGWLLAHSEEWRSLIERVCQSHPTGQSRSIR